MIEVTINGAAKHFPQPMNVAQLVVELNLVGKRIAIERNGDIVPRSQFDTVALASDDILEIVVAVGGG